MFACGATFPESLRLNSTMLADPLFAKPDTYSKGFNRAGWVCWWFRAPNPMRALIPVLVALQ
jgi:hypothetical protein